MTPTPILKNTFGRTGPPATIVGLGGEGVLRTHGREEEATTVIEEAFSAGITYFESARAYAGSEKYYGLVWPEHAGERTNLFQTSKSAIRDRKGALSDLHGTLTNTGLEYLDLWQIHDVRTEEDFEAIAGPGGALEAFVQAKAEGKVRFIGVTGHHNPTILTRAVNEWPVDSVLMPVNPVEGILGGFLDDTLPAAGRKGIAVIGMKVLGASHYLFPDAGITPEVLIRYALSHPITLVVVGCSSIQEVRTLAHAGQNFTPMSPDNMRRVEKLFEPHARRLAFYRGTS
jgi:predicted aldo/keto reductase-like oxidoreductase